MGKRLFVFDLDGTLADTGEGIKYALEVFEDRLGLSHFPKEQADFMIGPPVAESVARTHPELDGPKIEDYGRYFNEVYDEVLLHGVKPYEGIPELLDYIHEKGGTICVATAKIGRQALRVLKHCNLYEKIDYLRPWAEGENKTIIMNCVIDHFGIDKQDIISIGDSHFDGIAARDNDIELIAVKYGYGFGRVDDETEFNPKYVVNSTKELRNLIEELI